MGDQKTQKIYTLDVRGEYYTVLTMRLAEKIREVEVGAVLKIISDDLSILDEIRKWCDENSHKLVGHFIQEDVITIYIQKAN